MRIGLSLVIALVGTLVAEIQETTMEHAGAKFRVVRVEAGRVDVVWKNPKGEIYRTFDRVQADFSGQGKSVKFLMNAGIFEPGGIPSGLHVENGKTLLPINLADAEGNFFLKPNGVVACGKSGGFIGTPDAWEKWRAGKTVDFALQSGPLLLIGGRRHPAFREGSPNKLHRNGVGYDASRRILIFAITDKREEVNLWDFAGLFLALGCKDALFLDGDISQMAVNPAKPVESNPFGAILVVAE